VTDGVVPAGECWEWTGTVDQGHPVADVDGRRIRVRRAVYELEHGRVKRGAAIVNTCGNALCVNPDHCALGS